MEKQQNQDQLAQEQNQTQEQELVQNAQNAQINRLSPLQHIIFLPQLCYPKSNPFKPMDKQFVKDQGISQQVKDIVKKLHEQLNKQFKVFFNPKNYRFTLPESKFPGVPQGQRNMITYEQKSIVQEEDTFRDRLSPQQIDQIRQDGQFKVKSNRDYITLPYIWKINEILLVGQNNIEKNWFRGISNAFSAFYNAFNALKKRIPYQIKKLKSLPMRIFSLIFGRRKMKTIVSVDYTRQIAKQFWNQVMQKYYFQCKEWGSQIWLYFYVDHRSEYFQQVQQKNKQIRQKLIKEKQKKNIKYQKQQQQSDIKKAKFATVHANFMAYWPKIKKRTFDEVSQTFSNNINGSQTQNQKQSLLKKQKTSVSDQQILQAFDDKKFTIYVDYIKQNLPKHNVPNAVIQSVVTIITIFSLLNKKMRKFQKLKRQQNQKIRVQIKQKHRIKSLNHAFFQYLVQQTYAPIQKRLKQQFYQNLYNDKELQSKLNTKQKAVYRLWLNYIANYQTILNAKKNQIKQIQGPSRIFYSTYMLLPPFKLIKNQSQDYTYYSLQKQKGMQIGTDTNFWKFKLYAMRLKCWTINCVVFLLYCSWTGPFGLRCLYGKQKFRFEQYLADYQTGEIRNNMRKPFIAVFLTVLDGIKKSRDNFQALPDRGLFGKNLSRYFNYAQCYVFRFLIVGVLLTLILYPIGIIVLSFLCAFFILTIWIWSPLILFFTYLFNILVFQFESSHTPYGFFIRSVPLLSLIISLLTSIFKVLFAVISLVVIAPLIACFWSVFSLIQRLFRTTTDFIMITLISKLGRTPSRNTAIAKKISGPGMSRQFYMSITEEDVYVLTQAELQKIYMQQFDRVMRTKINQPNYRFRKTMNLFLKPFSHLNNGHYLNIGNCVTTNVHQLSNNYSKTYNNYMARFPNRPYNVRFTQEQLAIYLDNSSAIVKNFVNKKNLKNWIFDHFQILQDWDQLTRRIWVQIFQCGQQIFEPLQKIDSRFKLQDQYSYEQSKYGSGSSYKGKNIRMRKNVESVMNALEGQVQLSHKRAKVSPFKHSLMNQQSYSQGIYQLVRLSNQNVNCKVQLNLSDPKSLFCCHLNIKQLYKYDDYVRRKAIKAAKI